jgi:myosin V
VQWHPSAESPANSLLRLSPNQIQKLLNQYLVADYEQPINGEIMKAVASRVTEKSDVLLLQAVDMDDSGPYEIAEPRVITALETYTPSCTFPLPVAVSDS